MILEVLRSDPHLGLLALLASGHFLGDFLLQSRRMAVNKRSTVLLLAHGGLIVLAHLAVALPFLDPYVMVAVVLIGLSHLAIDGLKARVGDPALDSLWLLLIDQAAHVTMIVGIWLLLGEVAGPPVTWISDDWLAAWVTASVVGAAFALNATGGSAIVRAVLGPLGGAAFGDRSGSAGAGRLIGILERTITLILILAGQWAAMALLATAKSVARFDDLKDRRFAEYYLVGTLSSLLVAILVGLALLGIGV